MASTRTVDTADHHDRLWRDFSQSCLRVSTTTESGYQCDKTWVGSRCASSWKAGVGSPEAMASIVRWYRNVVEMMMKRTVRTHFMFSSVKQMSLDSHSVLRHCCGSHFYLELQGTDRACKNDSRRGSRNTASVCWGNDDSSGE
jgi:hypothetical protein